MSISFFNSDTPRNRTRKQEIIQAIGGNIVDFTPNNPSNNVIYRMHKFTEVGSDSFIVISNPIGTTIDVLVVAGGGGGGSWVGGGGGAGGLLYEENLSVIPGSVSITIGAGGIGSLNPGGYSGMPNGSRGGDSSFGDITAIGGGMGASHTQNNTSDWMDGGSGGGNSGEAQAVQGMGVVGQGNNGGIGHGNNPWSTGGGGGAGEAGQDRVNGDISGNGGDGLYFGDKFGDDLGDEGWFAGGGGGGKHDAGGSAGAGGKGGGSGGLIATTAKAPNAQSNTGGGGGGSGNSGGSRSEGGDGGSGVVLIRYRIS